MKNNKGVTITSLVIYVASFLMIVGVVALITTFFYNNTRFLSSEATASAEYDILNAYLLNETKIENNLVEKTIEENNRIKFSKGNEYIFEEGEGKIYYKNQLKNKYFVLCNYIQSAEFNKVSSTEYRIKVKILGKEYEQTYMIEN